MFVYQFIICPILFSFMYQLCHVETLNIHYFCSRSQCDNCKKAIRFLDLIPILNFIILKGKSRCCQCKLKYTYLVGELLSLIPSCLLLIYKMDIHPTTFLLIYLFLLVLAIYDFETYTIPLHIVIIFIICITIICNGYFMNFIIATTFTHCIYFIFKGAIGYGDILLFSILAYLLPTELYISMVLLTFTTGGIITLFLICFIRKPILKVPLIPFILIGFILANII